MCFARHSWQIALELLHHGCDLNVGICRKHYVFSRVNKSSFAEKSRLARDGLRRRRFAVEFCSKCARTGTEGSKVTFSLLCGCCDMLCYCFLHVLRHFVHWNYCITAICSTGVCCFSSALCNSACADRSGMAVSTLLERHSFCSTVLRV